MRRLNALRIRLRALLRRGQLDRDLEDELQFHLEMKTKDNLAAGVHPLEARARATRQFGNSAGLKEISREMFGFGSLETLARDLRYGLRTLGRNPGFTATIIVTLALGIGANTAIFSLINAVMLRSLPVASPEQLVSVGDASRTASLHNGPASMDLFSYPVYKKLRERNPFGPDQVFTGVLASGRTGRLDISVPDSRKPDAGSTGETATGRLVSANYFDVLGVRPLLGRAFAPEDDRAPGASAVVVISFNYWRTRLGGDPDVLGKQIGVNGTKFTIVGVGPRDFLGDVVGVSADLWIPLMMQPQVNPGAFFLDKTGTSWLLFMGRLKPGVSLAQARATLNVLMPNLFMETEGSAISQQRLSAIREMKVQVEPGGKGFSAALRKRFSRPLLVLMGLVGLVLLIACTNVTSLLLARATNRRREIGMRLTLGASRFRLIRQLLTESILLALFGGAAGLLLAWWGARILLQLASADPSAPLPLNVHPDPNVLSFTAGAALFTGFLLGLAPALRATESLAPALKERSTALARGGARWNLGQTLVIAQVALSLLLLVGAGLFARTLRNLETLDVGYRREGLAILEIDPIGSGYKRPQAVQVCRALLAKLQAAPGVQAAAVSEDGIFSGTDASAGGLVVDGFTAGNDRNRTDRYDRVGPHYFGAVGIPLLQGRDFDERDDGAAPKVAIINEAMARFYFPHADPLGKHLKLGGENPAAYTIVGVSRDARDHQLKEPPPRRFYMPYFEDTDDPIDGFYFEIRTARDAASIIPGIRATVREFDRNLKVLKLAAASSMIDRTIADERLVAQLSGLLGALALLLAGAGLYGVMSYSASRRSGEIGLRMALGANRGSVIWMVLRESLLLALLGIVIGVPAALAAAKLAERSIVALSAADPLVLAAAAAILLATAAVAGLLPASRASRIDPIIALRQE